MSTSPLPRKTPHAAIRDRIVTNLYAGYAGTGAINVTGGGKVTSGTGYIGTFNGSVGTVTVSGTDTNGNASLWNANANGGTIEVGASGMGTLNVQSGGRVAASSVYVGYNSDGAGTLNVSGSNGAALASTLSIASNEFDVGFSGTGALNITGGGKANTAISVLGHAAGSTGTVSISGSDASGNASTWSNGTSNLDVGYSGTGSLSITGGGVLNSGTGYIGLFGGSTGTVTVSGLGSTGSASTWNVGVSGLEIGYQGAATLNITNGGKVTTGAMPTYLNVSGGSSSVLNINGGSLTSDTLSIGTGSVAISLTNPTASNGGGYALNLGNNNGSTTVGVVIADAAGGAGGIDKTGTGTLTLNAANTFSGGMQIDGGVVVMGSVSALQNSTAIINVNNGLNVNGAQSVSIGGLAGTGSLAIGSTSLAVGSNNQSTTYSGSLAASSFGKVGSGTLTLTNASNSIVNIAQFEQGATLIQASSGTGSTSFTVPLADIGSYTTGDATVTVLGTNGNGAPALLNLTDTSQYAASLFVGVGSSGTATVNVLGGAKVMSNGAYLGYNSNTTGIVTVSGTDTNGHASTWDFGNGGIAIGGNGTGIVNIQAGATVTGNYTAVAPFGGTSALLNINGGRLITNLFSGGSGTVKLTNPTAANGGGYALNLSGSGDISVAVTDAAGGAGGIQKTGTGTLTLTGASTYSGGTLIGAGTIVGSGGTISGTSVASGALGTGLVTVASGATLSVGQAPNATKTNRPGYGTLSVSALTLTSGSTTSLLTFDLGPTSSADGSTNDFLKLSGSANSLVFSGAGAFDVGFASESGASITGSPTYELMSFATPIALTSATVTNPNTKFVAVGTGNLGTIHNGSFSWVTSGGNITGLQFGFTSADATPEPSALALLLGPSGCLAFAAYRRRRHSR